MAPSGGRRQQLPACALCRYEVETHFAQPFTEFVDPWISVPSGMIHLRGQALGAAATRCCGRLREAETALVAHGLQPAGLRSLRLRDLQVRYGVGDLPRRVLAQGGTHPGRCSRGASQRTARM